MEQVMSRFGTCPLLFLLLSYVDVKLRMIDPVLTNVARVPSICAR